MKRFFFMTIALAAVAVGCTKSGLLESPQTYEEPITFEPYSGRTPVTKATVEDETSLKNGGFHVTGFIEEEGGSITTVATDANPTPYYLDRDVKWGTPEGTETEKWYYEEAMYWPEGENISFVAYGLNVNNDDSEDIFKMKNNDYTLFTYSVPSTPGKQKDLVISPILKGKNSTVNGPIMVTLYHVLSRIGFKVKPSGTAGINVLIKNVTLTGNFYTTGTFDLETAVILPDVEGDPVTYTPAADQAKSAINYSLFDSSYSLGYAPNPSTPCPGFVVTSDAAATAVPVWNNCSFSTGEINPEDITPPTLDTEGVPTTDALKTAFNNRYMMIMPQAMPTDAKLVVVYHLEDGIEREVDIPLPADLTFAAGKAYEFVFTVSTVAVNFDVIEVESWSPYFTSDNDDTSFTEGEGYLPLVPVE